MSKFLDEVLSANQQYGAGPATKAAWLFGPHRLADSHLYGRSSRPRQIRRPRRRGDAHVIRNAGDRVYDDAIRSLIEGYKLLGTMEFFGDPTSGRHGVPSLTTSSARLISKLARNRSSHGRRPRIPGGKAHSSRAAQYIEFLTIPNQKQAVIDDVERIRNHPLVPASIPVYGYVYDVKTGKLIEIEEATKIGAAS